MCDGSYVVPAVIPRDFARAVSYARSLEVADATAAVLAGQVRQCGDTLALLKRSQGRLELLYWIYD
jgi:hypothetical protein